MSRVYVYALVEQQRGPLTIRGRAIAFLSVGGVHAAVSMVKRPPRLTERALRAQHALVVALARRCDPILPVRFGAWLEPGELERVIQRRSRLLIQAFELVRHKEQMTLRVFAPLVRSPTPRPPMPSGTAYLQARREATDATLPRGAAAMRRALKAISTAERMDAGVGRIRATLHHLIERGRADEYRAIVQPLGDRLPEHEQVVVSGPWPPFAFTPDLWS